MIDRCAYRNRSGLRCRYPGTVSHSSAGRAPWYCCFGGEPHDKMPLGEAERLTIRSQLYDIMGSQNRAHNPGPPNCGDSSSGDKQAA